MDFFKNFYNKYLSVNLADYENIKVNLDINFVVLGVTLALIIACFGLYRHQTQVATLYKKLIRKEAYGTEGATSLKELGLTDKSYRKILTERYGNIKKSLVIAGERRMTYEEYTESFKSKKGGKIIPENETADSAKIPDIPGEVLENSTDTETESGHIYENDGMVSTDAKFYIPEDKKDLAYHILSRNGATLPRTLISCGLILAIGLTLFFTMPDILSAINAAL